MISKVLVRGLNASAHLIRPALPLLSTPRFHFAKELDKISRFRMMLNEEIKSEKESLNDVSPYEQQFKDGGWQLNL